MKSDKKILQELEDSREKSFRYLKEDINLIFNQIKLLGDNLKKRIEIQKKKVENHFLSKRRMEFLEWVNSKEIIELAKTDKQIQDYINQTGYSLFSII